MLTHGLSVSRETFSRLNVYVGELVRWQKRMNLIGPAKVDEIWQRHIRDSWQVAEMITKGDRVVDMGSGAGLPGLLIAIRLAEVGGGSITMIEANGKKCSFLNHVRRTLNLPSEVTIQVVNDRVQNVLPDLTDVNVTTARAFASLSDLFGHVILLPNVSTVRHIFPKGRNVDVEINQARHRFDFDMIRTKSKLEGDGVILDVTNLRSL